MKLKITFAQDNNFNHTINGVANIPSTKSSDTFYLIYNLTKNCSTTDKFIDLCKQTFQSDTFRCDYNFYKNKHFIKLGIYVENIVIFYLTRHIKNNWGDSLQIVIAKKEVIAWLRNHID